eukprot:g16902.t2
MHAFRYLRSRSAAPFTVAAAGLWASSSRSERRTAAEPAAVQRQPSKQRPAQSAAHGDDQSRAKGDGDGESGPMVAVFLDEPSVNKLKSHFPEARDGQLRKVVIQYRPSASERQMYRHLFGGTAEVTVTGDASSVGRRALVASVSHAGRLVEPVSLSATIDISPPLKPDVTVYDDRDGPGPFASAVLIEQVKKAGATKEETWEGMLPPLLAHNRQFPREPGAYTRLKEPITVRGTICRADWVDGASIVCRDRLEGGEERQEDWKPSNCYICEYISVTPCNGIFNRFIEATKRHQEYLETFKPEKQGGEDVKDGHHISEREVAATTDAKAGGGEGSNEGSTTVARTGATRDDRSASEAAPGAEGSPSEKKEEHVTAAVENAAGDGRSRQAERDLIDEQLEKESRKLFNEMKKCMEFHAVPEQAWVGVYLQFVFHCQA